MSQFGTRKEIQIDSISFYFCSKQRFKMNGTLSSSKNCSNHCHMILIFHRTYKLVRVFPPLYHTILYKVLVGRKMAQKGCDRDSSRDTNLENCKWTIYFPVNWAIRGFLTITWSEIIVETWKWPISAKKKNKLGHFGVSTTISDPAIFTNSDMA